MSTSAMQQEGARNFVSGSRLGTKRGEPGRSEKQSNRAEVDRARERAQRKEQREVVQSVALADRAREPQPARGEREGRGEAGGGEPSGAGARRSRGDRRDARNARPAPD